MRSRLAVLLVLAAALVPPLAPCASIAKTVAVEQADREFVPYVSVIQTGTAVGFPNRDAILHHVYSPVDAEGSPVAQEATAQHHAEYVLDLAPARPATSPRSTG